MPPESSPTLTLPPAPRKRPATWVGALLLVGAASALVLFLAFGAPDRASRDFRFVIPAGTAARLAEGEALTVLPERLDVQVGDSITLVNEDDAVQQTGFLAVGPRETLTYRFRRVGTYVSECTLHPGGTLQIVVSG